MKNPEKKNHRIHVKPARVGEYRSVKNDVIDKDKKNVI